MESVNCVKEHLSADELRLLQNVLNTDRKTIDYIEGVIAGLDMTERRASAGVLIMKVRRMLDRELSDEMERRKAQLEVQQATLVPQPDPVLEARKGPLGIVTNDPPGDVATAAESAAPNVVAEG